VKPTAHTAKSVATPKAGRFATLRGRHPARGSGAPARSSVVAILASLCALAVGLFFAAPAFALTNPERTYEMVSPTFKAGYSASSIMAVAPDGESVAFASFGAFAGVPWAATGATYIAHRESNGWVTTGLQPPPWGATADFSANLQQTLSSGYLEHHGTTEEHFLVHQTNTPDTAADWQVLGGKVFHTINGQPVGAIEDGASGNFCHVVLFTQGGSELLPEAAKSSEQLYDYATGCSGDSSLGLVGAKNRLGAHGEPEALNAKCPTVLGISVAGYRGEGPGEDAQEAAFNSISEDGNSLFFTTNVEKGIPDCAGGVHQLFVRLGGARTLEVSRPLDSAAPFGGCVGEGAPGEVPCAGATQRASSYFKGASEDGSRVFFTTTAPLTSEDTDAQNDLYMATIGCPSGETEGCEAAQRRVTSVIQVSHTAAARQPAEVQGVLKVAADGSRVYFVAHGVLSEGTNAEGRAPVEGAENLYVYERDARYPQGHNAFIADLCSGPGVSALAEDARCPTSLDTQLEGKNDTALWKTGSAAQATPDGRFVVFSSYGQLTKDDTDTTRDIYRYDAVNGVLDRVSIGEAGNDANGNNSEFAANLSPASSNNGRPSASYQHELFTRAISDDGARIVFTTAEPLSASARNGHLNVYEWHKGEGVNEGAVSLISSGTSVTDDTFVVISSSGRDIFFTTSQGLVPQDSDGETDIYDARVDGGFAAGPAEPQQCSGDACQGPLSNPAPLLIPGSVSQTPGEVVAAPTAADATKATSKPKNKKKVRHARRKGHGSKK
jgi:hypothetical protein